MGRRHNPHRHARYNGAHTLAVEIRSYVTTVKATASHDGGCPPLELVLTGLGAVIDTTLQKIEDGRT